MTPAIGTAATNAPLTPGFTVRSPLDNSSRSPRQNYGTASAALTTTPTVPTGCYYVTPTAGNWLMMATVDYQPVLDGTIVTAQLYVDGTALSTGPLGVVSLFPNSGTNPNACREGVSLAGVTGSIASAKQLDVRVAYIGNGGTVYGQGGTSFQVVQIG